MSSVQPNAVAPVAPHSQSNVANGAVTFDPPVPALRHANLFPSAKTPRPSSFNPDVASGVSWVQQLEKLNQTNLDYLDYYYQQRLRSLQAVDELVDAVFRKLEKAGLLENTSVLDTRVADTKMFLHLRLTRFDADMSSTRQIMDSLLEVCLRGELASPTMTSSYLGMF